MTPNPKHPNTSIYFLRNGCYKVHNVFQFMTVQSLFSRHIPATCSLLKVGRIIDYGFLTTWLRSTDYYPSNGWQRFGGRIPFSKMQKALPFKRWLFLITTFGFGKTKPSSTWSSKHSFNVSISMNHNGWLVLELMVIVFSAYSFPFDKLSSGNHASKVTVAIKKYYYRKWNQKFHLSSSMVKGPDPLFLVQMTVKLTFGMVHQSVEFKKKYLPTWIYCNWLKYIWSLKILWRSSGKCMEINCSYY